MMYSPGVYLHSIDPFALGPIDIGPFKHIGLRWYGLSYLTGFVFAWWLARRVVRCGRSTLKVEQVSDLVVAWAIGIIVGGRLGYVLFYKISMLWTFTDSLPYWDLLAINKGGMASHGGMIGFIIASWVYARRHGHSVGHLLDLGACGAPIGLFFGRLANFVNGELYGRGPTEVAWAVRFPHEILTWDVAKVRSLDAVMPHMPAGMGYDQIIDQVQMGNTAVANALAPLLLPRHPSQIYEALLEGLLLFVVMLCVWYRPRKPLVVASWFCIVYAGVRIFGEQFREPDDHIGFDALGLTRGQWLSVGLMAAGVVLLVIFSRRQVERMGGWVCRKTDDEKGKDTGEKSGA